jgi:hypothetical protein
MFMALVVKGVRRMCSFLFAQDLMYAFDVSLRPKAQVLEYQVTPGKRHSISLDCWTQYPVTPATAAAAVTYQAPVALEAFAPIAGAAYGCTGQEQLNPAVADYLQQQLLPPAPVVQDMAAVAGSSCSSSCHVTSTTMAVATDSAVASLQDKWAWNSTCRFHGVGHTNGECKLQLGMQGECEETQYAAAFKTAGLLSGLDEQYTASSSTFLSLRRESVESSNKSGGVTQHAALPSLHGSTSHELPQPKQDPSSEACAGATAAEMPSSTTVLPASEDQLPSFTSTAWDAVAEQELQHAYQQQLQVLTVQLLYDSSAGTDAVGW